MKYEHTRNTKPAAMQAHGRISDGAYSVVSQQRGSYLLAWAPVWFLFKESYLI